MRAMSASWILDSAPEQTSGPVAVGSIAGVDREIGGGVVCVPSGAARGLWRMPSNDYWADSVAIDPNDLQDGDWITINNISSVQTSLIWRMNT